MIGYVTVGADDINRAERFYCAILPRLGYRLEVSDEGLSYVLSGPRDGSFDPPDFPARFPCETSVGRAAGLLW